MAEGGYEDFEMDEMDDIYDHTFTETLDRPSETSFSNPLYEDDNTTYDTNVGLTTDTSFASPGQAPRFNPELATRESINTSMEDRIRSRIGGIPEFGDLTDTAILQLSDKVVKEEEALRTFCVAIQQRTRHVSW